jgi:hypothetical protein
LVIAVFLWVGGQRVSQQKRLNLTSYIVLLLVDESVRDSNSENFQQWIAQSDATNAMELGLAASKVIETFADNLAADGSPLLGANAALWNSDAARSLRERK